MQGAACGGEAGAAEAQGGYRVAPACTYHRMGMHVHLGGLLSREQLEMEGKGGTQLQGALMLLMLGPYVLRGVLMQHGHAPAPNAGAACTAGGAQAAWARSCCSVRRMGWFTQQRHAHLWG